MTRNYVHKEYPTKYPDPSPEEIAAACAEIRSQWPNGIQPLTKADRITLETKQERRNRIVRNSVRKYRERRKRR